VVAVDARAATVENFPPSAASGMRLTMKSMEGRVPMVLQAYKVFQETRTFLTEWYTDDFVWDMSTFDGWPEKREYVGVDGVQEFVDTWTENWEDWRFQVRDLVEAPGGEIVAILHQQARAKESGVDVDMTLACVWEFRDDKFSRQSMYADPAQALAAVGAERRAGPR
jgi:ketosteroid isomerase-like protein